MTRQLFSVLCLNNCLKFIGHINLSRFHSMPELEEHYWPDWKYYQSTALLKFKSSSQILPEIGMQSFWGG